MYIAIDVGGTNIRIALVDLSGKESIIKLESHRVPQDYSTGIEGLSEHIAALSKGKDIQGIGACFPGIIDENEMATIANNLPDWTMKPIIQKQLEMFPLPEMVLVERGSECAIWLRGTFFDRYGVTETIKRAFSSPFYCMLIIWIARAFTSSWMTASTSFKASGDDLLVCFR